LFFFFVGLSPSVCSPFASCSSFGSSLGGGETGGCFFSSGCRSSDLSCLRIACLVSLSFVIWSDSDGEVAPRGDVESRGIDGDLTR
jgi:hypothetical protein